MKLHVSNRCVHVEVFHRSRERGSSLPRRSSREESTPVGSVSQRAGEKGSAEVRSLSVFTITMKSHLGHEAQTIRRYKPFQVPVRHSLTSTSLQSVARSHIHARATRGV